MHLAVALHGAGWHPAACRPYISVSADVVVAGTEAEARELAAGYGLWVRSIRTGEGAIQFPPPNRRAATCGARLTASWSPTSASVTTTPSGPVDHAPGASGNRRGSPSSQCRLVMARNPRGPASLASCRLCQASHYAVNSSRSGTISLAGAVMNMQM
jgi:hypothetical protein